MPGKSALTAAEKKGMYFFNGDRVYRWMQNTEATARTYGMAVAADVASGGEQFFQPTTASLNFFVGVVNDMENPTDTTYSIAAGDYGWVCIYGPVEAYVLGTGTATVVGDTLKCVNSQNYLFHDSTTGTEAAYFRKAVALEANAGAVGLYDVFVKAL